MSLISPVFALFFGVTLLLYYLLPKKCQWIILLIAGTVFYLWSGILPAIWILATTAVTFAAGLLTESTGKKLDALAAEVKGTLSKEEYKAYQKKNEQKKKLWLRIALAVDFGILCVLKYLDFIIGNFDRNFGGLGLVVPLGLSYFTFAAVGYIVDVSRGKYAAERNFFRFALYISYFPQIIEGPIPRFDKLSPQLKEEHSFDIGQVLDGLRLVLWGIFKMLVISAPMGTVVSDLCTNGKNMSGISVWIGMIAWGIQLYTNFSGGINIVTGVSGCFGITLGENFRRPYFATDLTDYWNRWHISLSDWLRDYMFYPMALSKRYSKFTKFLKKKFGKFIARTVPVGLLSLLMFTVVGIWHGANWGEILFGVFNGIIILASTLLEPVFEKIRTPLKMKSEGGIGVFWRIFRSLRTFVLITLTRVISRAPSVGEAMSWYGRMFAKPGFALFASELSENGRTVFVSLIPALCGCIVLFAVSLIEERSEKHSVRAILGEKPAALRVTLEVLLLVSVVVFGSYGLGYDAAAMIYQQY